MILLSKRLNLLLLLCQWLWIAVDSNSDCTPFQSISTDITCTGTLNTSLTIPCGQLQSNNDSSSNFTYQLYPLFNQASSITKKVHEFLVLRLQLTYHGMRVICFNDANQKQAVYKLNVTYGPYTTQLTTLPSISVRFPVTITCPIEANPTPNYRWIRYNDIDQANVLPLPTEFEFSDDNKTWSVQDWRESMNGFYVCCATNYISSHCFNNQLIMRLFATICDGTTERDGFIGTSDNRQVYSLADTIIVQCIAFNAIHNQPPNWFFANNTGINVRIPFIPTPIYRIQYSYDRERCLWNSTLTISHFSLIQTGTYKCSYGQLNRVHEINLDLEACDKLSRDNVSVTILPNNSVVGMSGVHVVLSCMVNGTPSDGIPSWCKISGNDCILVNSTSSINRNCSWLNTIDINITDTTIGQYRCVIFNQMAQVKVSLLREVDRVQVSKISPTALVSSLVVSTVIIIVIITSVFIILHWYRITRYSRTHEPSYEGFKYDVFISYHSEVEDFAYLRVKEPLEANGYSVCWHHSHFIGGVTIADNINEAVDSSRKVIFLFTENFTTSNYCMMELNRTLDRLQSTRTRCMVPIALKESAVPIELKSTVTYWPIIDSEKFSTDKLMEIIGSPIMRNTTVQVE